MLSKCMSDKLYKKKGKWFKDKFWRKHAGRCRSILNRQIMLHTKLLWIKHIPPIAEIHFSSIYLFFPLYLSHAWLTSGGLNQHWKWPMLLDLPLPLFPFFHLFVSPPCSSSPTASMIGLDSPANPEGKHSLRVSLSHLCNKLPSVKKPEKKLQIILIHTGTFVISLKLPFLDFFFFQK